MRFIYITAALYSLLICLDSCESTDPAILGAGHYVKSGSRIYYVNERGRRVSPSEAMQLGVPRSPSKDYSDVVIVESDHSELLDGSGKYVGQFKVGNPYTIGDTTYYPKDYEDYEEVGIASWYGDQFHRKATANGEVYNKGDLTAAHPTLPLPSIVEVTNLSNGKSVKVRINDRGPFAKNRIIDMSETAAAILDFRDKGTAEVRVRFLKEDTASLLRKLKIQPS